MILSEQYNIYVTACDENGGIYHIRSDGKGNAEIKNFYRADRPMYLIVNGGKLHCLLRAPFEGSENSGLVTYDIAPDGGLENPTDIISTKGEVACHLAETDGSIYCVNYLSGSVIKLPDKLDIHHGSGPHPTRQEAAHTHFVGVSPDGKYIFVTDLGMDKIFVYDLDLNAVSDVSMPAGHGPRHLAMHPDGEHVFCVNELRSTVSVLKYSDGRLTLTDTVETLPENFKGKNTAAAIRYSDGSVYVSHRGYDAVTVLDFRDGGLYSERSISAYGKSPRDLWVDDEILICTNQDSDNVTFISRESGSLLFEFKMKCPICAAAVKA